MPDCALYLAHLDRTHAVHRIVDTRGGAGLGLRSNLASPLADSFDVAMTEERAPRLCNDLAADPVYAGARRAAPRRRRRLPRRAAGALRRRPRRRPLRPLPARRPLPRRRRAAVHDARPRAGLRAGARVQRARPQAPERQPARPRPRHGRRRPGRPRAGRRRGRPPRRLPRGLRDGRLAGLLPARAVGPRVRLDRDERRRHGAGHDPAAPGHHGPRVHRARELLRPRRALAPRAGPAARGRHRRRARRCSSPCCATASSPAC